MRLAEFLLRAFGGLALVGAMFAFSQNAATPSPSPEAEDAAKVGGYQFDPNSIVRDPFEPPSVNKGDDQIEEIYRYDIKEVKVVAIMKGLGSPKVMVKLPSGNYHILQTGDSIGKSRDKVFKIMDTSITFEKILRDFKGNTKSQFYTVEMENKEKKGK